MAETLVVVDETKLKQELQLFDPKEIKAVTGSDTDLDTKADQFADLLFNIELKDVQAQNDRKDAVNNMGLDLQSQASKQSEMLKTPIKKLAQREEDGGSVAQSLVDLKMQVEDLDPGKFDFEAGWFTRVLGQLPGVGTPLKRYFTKFESAQTVIDAILRSLEEGKTQLTRDNKTLGMDQKKMRENTFSLEQHIRLAQLIDERLSYKLEREIGEDEEQKQKFVEEELLFPLRQRVIDLQQQLAVNQQGVLSIEILIRNNKELIRGVNRAQNVTVTALNVAVTVALALANQKIVLDKIDAINKTTSNLIENTAARLKTQGAEIHKQASKEMLDMQSLKNSFADISAALEDLSTFRQKALPKMANTILELDQMSKAADERIQQMERGNNAIVLEC